MVNFRLALTIGISYSKAAPVILKERMDEAVAFLDSIGMVDIVPKKGWEAHFAKAGELAGSAKAR